MISMENGSLMIYSRKAIQDYFSNTRIIIYIENGDDMKETALEELDSEYYILDNFYNGNLILTRAVIADKDLPNFFIKRSKADNVLK
jgi:hypothetical protein